MFCNAILKARICQAIACLKRTFPRKKRNEKTLLVSPVQWIEALLWAPQTFHYHLEIRKHAQDRKIIFDPFFKNTVEKIYSEFV